MYISVQESQHSDRYHCLANAIIVQAAKDYEMALIAEANQRPCQVRSAEVERFFKSNWYRLMTNLDEDIIIEKIQAKVKKKIMNNQKTKKRLKNLKCRRL